MLGGGVDAATLVAALGAAVRHTLIETSFVLFSKGFCVTIYVYDLTRKILRRV